MVSIDWNDLALPLVLLAIPFVLLLLVELVSWVLPCVSQGPTLHRRTLATVTDDVVKCTRCNTSWKLVDKLYSVASAGDTGSYWPVWQKVSEANHEQKQARS